MKTTFYDCTWAVAYKIDKKTQDDRKTKIRVVATFSHAEDGANFIKKCLPQETRKNFFVISTVALEKCNDADKVKRLDYSEESRVYAYIER